MTSPPSASDTSYRASSSHFPLLHHKVQRWVYARRWERLNDVQEEAIPLVLGGRDDIVVSAATASGKTEAAFLPICSALLDGYHEAGVQVLYISPLKALINDQHRRLDELCEQLDIPVHRWHGDVSGSAKSKVVAKPDGVLLITPESLEALFVLRGPDVGRIFRALRWVVIDEMHSFMGTERGAQLQSLLHRIELATRRRVPRIGLSATLGNMTSAASFLRPGQGHDVHVLVSDHGGGEIRLQLRGYLNTLAEVESDEDDEPVVEGSSVQQIADHLYGTLRGRNNLVFVNRRGQAELFADKLRSRSDEQLVPNEFFPHHGSLAKDVREYVEEQLKGGRPTTALCTSTLEMGIDIGTVASVAQIGAPPSVASLRQRVGRSGRRGEPAVLRMYVTAEEVTAETPPQDQLRAELFQAVAMIDLLGQRWYESTDSSSLQLSTLVQQVLSVIAQHQGAHPVELFRALCMSGPFVHVDQAMFVALLRDLGAGGLVQQESDGLLLLGKVGERIVNHFSFYAAFASSEEYRLVNGPRTLGALPVLFPTPIGSLLIFAGRRWRVVSVDDRAKVIEVDSARGGRVPNFAGGSAEIHDEVRRRMRVWYEADAIPAYLDSTAQRLLAEGRDAYRRLRLAHDPALAKGTETVVFPWLGDRVLNTLAVWLTRAGFETARDGIAFTASNCTPAQLRHVFQEMLTADGTSAEDLAASVPNTAVEKYDEYLGDDLRIRAYASGHLNMAGARAALADMLERMPEYDPDPTAGTSRPHQAGVDLTSAPYVVVDLETTGFAARGKDRILEVALVRLAPDGSFLGEWSSLVDPCRPIGAGGVHGISAVDVAGAPKFADLAPTIARHLEGAIVVAHNAQFDLGFLDAEFARAGVPLPGIAVVCTMKLDQRIHHAGKRSLHKCCAAAGIENVTNGYRAHRALPDAKAAAELFRHHLHTSRMQVRACSEERGFGRGRMMETS
jgi:ATP-dependent Lhr-like helicase